MNFQRSKQNNASDSVNPQESEKKNLGYLKRRSIPTGFDFDLDEVWLPKIQMKANRRFSTDTDPLCRTVPSQFYSRHQLLKGDHTIQPSITTSNSTPVYVYKPGKEKSSHQWPARAHDGSADKPQKKELPDRSEDNNLDADMFDF